MVGAFELPLNELLERFFSINAYIAYLYFILSLILFLIIKSFAAYSPRDFTGNVLFNNGILIASFLLQWLFYYFELPIYFLFVLFVGATLLLNIFFLIVWLFYLEGQLKSRKTRFEKFANTTFILALFPIFLYVHNITVHEREEKEYLWYAGLLAIPLFFVLGKKPIQLLIGLIKRLWNRR